MDDRQLSSFVEEVVERLAGSHLESQSLQAVQVESMFRVCVESASLCSII